MHMNKVALRWCEDTTDTWWLKKNLFRKQWACSRTEICGNALGDLCRGPKVQMPTKVKGHVTETDVDEGLVRTLDQEGNNWTDAFAA